MVVRRLDAAADEFASDLSNLLEWDVSSDRSVDARVEAIISEIKSAGDEALLRYTNELDRVGVDAVAALEVDKAAMEQAWQHIGQRAQQALQTAADRIGVFHQRQLEQSWSFTDDLGNELGQRITPLERVGVYVPGGRAAYPSSVLMTLIPAKVAGVDELVVVSPTPDGEQNEMVLAALHLAGAYRVFAIGGAQAVAALAYGTETVPRVDKIVGPGNAYVASAKRQVFGQVGIDMIAGPSEVLIIADGTTPVDWVVMDLFSQAEHDPAAQSILLCTDAAYIEAVAATIEQRLPRMQRAQTIAQSLTDRGALIYCHDQARATDVANRIAPEHLELAVAHPDQWVDGLRHAGAIFSGAYTGETFGDYVAGPSHVLPTYGTARFASPLGVYDFQKRSSMISFSAKAVAALGDATDLLASSEGLQAHALAARERMQKPSE